MEGHVVEGLIKGTMAQADKLKSILMEVFKK